jgi:hypothetical protein
VAILPLVSLIPVANLPPVPTTLVVSVANLPPVFVIPVVHLDLNDPNPIFRGLGEDDI